MADRSSEVLLIDLSSIAYPIYLTSASHADPNHASQQILARIRQLASAHPHAAICCDSGRSFRADIAASYKANRPEREAPLQHQIMLAKEQLAADGFPIWSVRTFEADDLIAAATARALATEDLSVLIVSADKDLLQLVGPRVRAMSARDGSIVDSEGVFSKFGVRPEQMLDYLTLVGDSADNVKGATGIGPKKAAELLAKCGTLTAVYDELARHPTKFRPALASSLKEFEPRVLTTRTLIQLRTDVDIPFHEIANDRVPKEAESFADFGAEDMEETTSQPTAERVAQDKEAPRVDAAQEKVIDLPGNSAPHVTDAPSASRLNSPASIDPVTPNGVAPHLEGDAGPSVPNGGGSGRPSTGLAIRDPESEMIMPAPAEWERQLDPRSMRDARQLAKDMYDSRMFSAYGTPQAVLSTMMVGRELGLPAMSSLRSIHNIEGKHALAASLMVALVLKSGMAEYFEPVSFDEKHATYVTKRKGGRREIELTHTIEMGRQAWPKAKPDWEKAFLASGWGKNPTDMLVARACARLARMVYPDLLAGLYTPEELAEIREAIAA